MTSSSRCKARSPSSPAPAARWAARWSRRCSSDGCRVAVIDVDRGLRCAALAARTAATVLAVACDIGDPRRRRCRARARRRRARRGRHPGQQRRHPLQQQARGDRRRRVAPRARRQSRRRVVLGAGGRAGDEGAPLGPDRQHQLARRQDRRPDRRHRVLGLQGRARRRSPSRWRASLPPHGVTANAIAPAYVRTPMVTEQLNEAQRQALLRADPGRPLLRAGGIRARRPLPRLAALGLHHRRDPRSQRRPADGLMR